MPASKVKFEHFEHGADIGVRGIGNTREQAFEQAALALSAIITDLGKIRPEQEVSINCNSTNDIMLLLDWLNAIIYEMAVRHMLFSRFEVKITDHQLEAKAWGETIDRAKHSPAVEPKGATFTAANVERSSDGIWSAQCVVDV